MLAQHSVQTAVFAKKTTGITKASSKTEDTIMMKDSQGPNLQQQGRQQKRRSSEAIPITKMSDFSFLDSGMYKEGFKQVTSAFKFPASDQTKDKARRMVQDVIKQEEKKVQDMNKLVEHNERLKAAREASLNKVGVMLSTRQIQKYQVKKRSSIQTIMDLELLIKEIGQSEIFENYAHKTATIVERNNSQQDPSALALTSLLDLIPDTFQAITA
jgi:hypothetical protein